MIGKTISHYRILAKLGEGGMGEVYRAHDSSLDREIALKVLPDRLASDEEFRRRFEREVKVLAALKHPNIVTIYSVEEVVGQVFYTMELVDGQSLTDLIPKRGMPLDRFFALAIPVVEAINRAHGQGIVHRDLKPSNIMLDSDGTPKILDFGLAKLRPVDASGDSTTMPVDGHETGAGRILGTIRYMSPEQAESKPVDQRSDIFSLGIVFYELATGERPFHGETPISTLSAIIKDEPASVTELNGVLPRHLDRIIMRCLAKNPNRRYQSALDLRNDLEGLKAETESVELSRQSLSGISRTARIRKSRPWLPWLIGASAAAAIAIATMFALRPEGSSTQAHSGAVGSASESRTETTSVAESRGAVSLPRDDRVMTVVLPFENLGPPDHAYFAAGITEEITSRLATVSELGVISRTSATQYDRTGKTMKQIGEDLGVDYVLEGTVRWADLPAGTGRVRITQQLIRASDDTHVWAETFDREIDDIFAVQTDIANRVTEKLDITLLGSERRLIASAPTDNIDAYQLYLQAKDLTLAGDYISYDIRFVELMQEAIALDPEFIEAQAELSRHHSVMYNALDMTEQRLAKAREALQRAEQIDPDHFETRLARGSYYYLGFRDYDRALEEYTAATKIVPNEAKAREMVAYIYRRQGKWSEAIENMREAIHLNPQEANIVYNLAETLVARREFDEALKYYDRAIMIDPTLYRATWNKAETLVLKNGDLVAAKNAMGPAPDHYEFWYFLGFAVLSMWDRDYDTAMEYCQQLEDSTLYFRVIKTHFIAQLEALRDGVEAARDALESSGRLIEELLENSPSNAQVRGWFAFNLAVLGQSDAAAREAKLVADLVAKDKFTGPAALEDLAEVYAIGGRHEEAIDILERLMNTVYEDPITPSLLQLSPAWDTLRGNPRFQQLLE